MGERIKLCFERAREAGRAAFIPYITAGDPDSASTIKVVRALDAAGADLIELGVPFSDPLADGPVIQRACQRGLASGMNLSGALGIARTLRDEISAAMVLFSYANPIVKMGEEVFANRCADAGLDGVLVTDLPVEEAGTLKDQLERKGLALILLVAPTSGPARIRLIAKMASGFIYYISRTGVTGSGAGPDPGISEDIDRIRAATELPVAVGFGIGSKAQFDSAASIADGVVVGSAIVQAMEASTHDPAAAAAAVARKIVYGVTE
jgi:tryptophan synthase alpha chain